MTKKPAKKPAKGKAKPERAMTPRQQLFCLEYLKDLNASAAYRRAGYKARNENVAAVQASKLLRNNHVALHIQASMDARAKDIKLDASDVLREILKLAKADVRKLYREDGSLKLPHEWDDDTAMAVAGVEVVESMIGEGENAFLKQTKKVKLWDKKGSLELLGRHLKLFTDVIEVKDITPMADKMKAARERAKGK